MNSTISIIIPTYNRAETLRKTLKGYATQLGDHKMAEVLVIDDGSKDHTAAVTAEEGACQSIVPIRYLYQENRGQAAARNHAIAEAKGNLILLGDDDIIPSKRMVESHVAWHLNNSEVNVGVLGRVAWAKELNPTPFMEWSGSRGPQFNFGNFIPGKELEFFYGYSCNTSVKVSFLREHGLFDEKFRTYGNEDIELTYRLCKKGFRLLYNPEAVGYHYKYETFEDTLKRIEKLYAAWPLFATTEAGQEMKRLISEPAPRGIQLVKSFLQPLKTVVCPILRPLCNTHVPLPEWLYNRIFYFYAETLFENAVKSELSPEIMLPKTSSLEQQGKS